MIINIRGTSGSGKSTLIRSVLDQFAARLPVHVPGRKRPLYYKLWRDGDINQFGPPDLVVLGHYDTACGGCDTIPTTDMTYDVILEAHYMLGAAHVLYEGLLISSDAQRTIDLGRNVGLDKLLVVELSTPLEECLASVNQRRAARDAELPPVDPKNTTAKWKGIQSSGKKIREAGVQVESLDRDAALARVLEVLCG
jgi:hypothetical protein